MSGDGMSDFITAITGTNGLTADTLWGEVANAVPLIVGVATFAIGFYIVRKLIKGFGKGKIRL